MLKLLSTLGVAVSLAVALTAAPALAASHGGGRIFIPHGGMGHGMGGFRHSAPAFSHGGAGFANTGGYGDWHRGGWRHNNGWGGFGAGVLAGSLLGSDYYGAYDGPYGYNGYNDYDDSPPVVEALPAGAGDSVGYCEAHFKSYNRATGMYLGYDGLRHPCP